MGFVGWTGCGLVMVIVLGSGGCGTSCGWFVTMWVGGTFSFVCTMINKGVKVGACD